MSDKINAFLKQCERAWQRFVAFLKPKSKALLDDAEKKYQDFAQKHPDFQKKVDATTAKTKQQLEVTQEKIKKDILPEVKDKAHEAQEILNRAHQATQDEQHIDWMDAEFVSGKKAAHAIKAKPESRMLLWAIIIFLLVALFWARFAVVEEVTMGQGQVIPSGEIQVIQNLEGGIVEEILMREGDIVEKDQILLYIDDTRFLSQFREGQLKANALRAKRARLNALINEEDFDLDELLEDAQNQAGSEFTLYEQMVEELRLDLQILEQQAMQKEQELLETQGRREQLNTNLELATEELNLTRPLVEEGIVSEVQLLRLERTVNDIQGDLNANQTDITQAEVGYQESQNAIAEFTISLKAELQEELNNTNAELSATLENNRALEDRVTRTAVRSPVRGTINQVNIATIGGVISPGMDIIEIVPLEDSLLVEAQIRPSDIAFLHPDQKAIVKISAYDFSVYGGLDARLVHISADTITDENGDHFYQIRVRTDEAHMEKDGEILPIIPGMIADVNIITGEKTVLSYLLKPILKTKENAFRER